jgi:hypothetical protein
MQDPPKFTQIGIFGLKIGITSDNPVQLAKNRPIWGRCYDHNFLRFSPIFGEKMAFFSKNNVVIKFLHYLTLF